MASSAMWPEQAAELIQYIARLAYLLNTRVMDREDWQHEIVLAVLLAIRFYDARRATLATFINHVARNRVATIFAAALAAKRGVRRTSSLDEYLTDDERDVPAPHSDIILSIAVRRVVDRLPAPQQRLAQLLSTGETVSEAAASLHISRAAAYRLRTQLRREFERAGLR